MASVNKDEFIDELRDTVLGWKDDIAVLEDDAERASGGDEDRYSKLMQDLYRDFEDIESRIDEFEEMDSVEFDEELPSIEERIQEFEQSLEDAREAIEDV